MSQAHVALVINNSLWVLLARQLTAVTVSKQQRETSLLTQNNKKWPRGQKSKFQ